MTTNTAERHGRRDRARYAYDPMGRRTVFGLQQGQDSEDWRFTFFGYDGDDVIAEYIIDAGYNPQTGEFTPRSDSARISATTKECV